MDAGLEIIPVLNKIDLPGAEPERRAKEIMDLIGAKREEILAVSAKEGTGVPELLEAVVARVPPPEGSEDAPLRALIFDSYYDRYRGAVPSIRVVDGVVREGMEIVFGAHPDDVHHVDEVGYLQLGQHPTGELRGGRGGLSGRPACATCGTPGWATPSSTPPTGRASCSRDTGRSSRWSSPDVYPTDSDQYENLRDALEKLRLNDASLHYEPESSTALGFRLSLRFSRSAAHGDRAGAAGARVRSRPDHHGAHRGVSRIQDRRRDAAAGEPQPTSPIRPASRGSTSPT